MREKNELKTWLSEERLFTMPQHIRAIWPPFRGREVLNFNWDIITVESVVHIVASEYAPRNQPVPPHDTEPRIVGAANIRVDNIAPHGPPSDPNHGVTFVVNVDWDSPLPIATDITVFDELPSVQYQEGALV